MTRVAFRAQNGRLSQLLYLSGRECRFRSKRGNHLRRFDQLCYWVRDELGTRDVILDGEVVALDEHGRQDFRALMAGSGNLHYAVFDVLWLKRKDLRECPLSRRKRILSRLVKHTSSVLSPVFGVRGRGRDLFAAVERLDLEGIVAKRLADRTHLTRCGEKFETARTRRWRAGASSSMHHCGEGRDTQRLGTLAD